MSLINSPSTTPVDQLQRNADGSYTLTVLEGWRNFFVAAYNICNAVTMSGTTAKRPIKGVYVGRVYFDTTLGYPIWALSITAGVVNWVDATGTPA